MVCNFSCKHGVHLFCPSGYIYCCLNVLSTLIENEIRQPSSVNPISGDEISFHNL